MIDQMLNSDSRMFFLFVTVVEIPKDELKGLGTKVIDDEDWLCIAYISVLFYSWCRFANIFYFVETLEIF